MKTIYLDSLPSYTKLELAQHQLNKAIELILDENDCISAITLAGAAEEILGDILRHQGETSAHQEIINECMILSKRISTETIKASEFSEIFTHLRNELKHYRQGSDITITAECANPTIDHAIENLRRLNVPESKAVQRYLNKRWSS